MDAALPSPITPPGGGALRSLSFTHPRALCVLQPTLVPLLYLSSEVDLKAVCRAAASQLRLLVGPSPVFIQEAAMLRAAELSSEADVNVSFQNMFAPGFFSFSLGAYSSLLPLNSA